MWQDKNGELYKKFDFKDFNEAFAFMQKVAKAANQANHHPKWLNEWSKVEIWLSTHEAGDTVTDKDHSLAKQIDAIYKEYES
jgi:4a-hydroxytetrahydrobiopterin dehydratase